MKEFIKYFNYERVSLIWVTVSLMSLCLFLFLSVIKRLIEFKRLMYINFRFNSMNILQIRRWLRIPYLIERVIGNELFLLSLARISIWDFLNP